MKEFRVLVTCPLCGESFDSDYKLVKHRSRSHPSAVMQQAEGRTGWAGGGEHGCSCGSSSGHHHHSDPEPQ